MENYLFHVTPAYAMTSIKRTGLKPRQGAGVYQHGGYDLHSQGKIFLSDSLWAASSWNSKLEAQLEYHHENSRKHATVLLRVPVRGDEEVDSLGDRDVTGSWQVREEIPASNIEFFSEEQRRWKQVADFRQGTSGWPESEEDAQAAGNKDQDVEERSARRASKRAELEAERQKTKERIAVMYQAREVREAREAASRPLFRDTAEGQYILATWKDRPAEEREAQARKMAKRPSPIPGVSLLAVGDFGALWREALGVDASGTLVRK